MRERERERGANFALIPVSVSHVGIGDKLSQAGGGVVVESIYKSFLPTLFLDSGAGGSRRKRTHDDDDDEGVGLLQTRSFLLQGTHAHTRRGTHTRLFTLASSPSLVVCCCGSNRFTTHWKEGGEMTPGSARTLREATGAHYNKKYYLPFPSHFAPTPRNVLKNRRGVLFSTYVNLLQFDALPFAFECLIKVSFDFFGL